MNISSYILGSELLGNKVRLTTIKRELRELNRVSVFSNLCGINGIFAKSMLSGNQIREYPEIQRRLKYHYLTPDIGSKAEQTEFKDRSVFFRQQTLFLAQLCLLNSRDDIAVWADGSTEGGYKLGELMLNASDHLLSRNEESNTTEGSDKRRIRHLGFQLAPAWELDVPLELHQGAVRSNCIYLTLLKSDEFKEILRKKNKTNFDISLEFQNATGISLEEYIDITVGLISVFLYYVPEDTGIVTHFTVDGFLRESTLRKETLEKYLNIEARDLNEFAEIFKNQSPQYARRFSFLPFRQYPLLQIPNGPYICIDPCFLTEKLNSGIYWKIVDNLGTKRSTFFEVFGYLFELYTRKLLESVCSDKAFVGKKASSTCLLFSSPTYRNNDDCFDEVIYYPETKHLLLIETKSSFIHSLEKYGRSIRGFRKEILKKFVQDKEGSNKGVGQLANHIANLFDRNKDNRRHLANSILDEYIQQAEKISPILIVQEETVSFHIIEDLLNEIFTNLLKRKTTRASVRISQLTVLNISTLEMLKPHIIDGEVTIEQCINSRNYRDPTYRSHFHWFVTEHFDLGRKTDKESDQIFSDVFDRAKALFFNPTNDSDHQEPKSD